MITSSQMEAISTVSTGSLLGLSAAQCDTLAIDNGNDLFVFTTHNAFAELGEQEHGTGPNDEALGFGGNGEDELNTTVINTAVSLLQSNSGTSQATPSGSKRRHVQSSPSPPTENSKTKSTEQLPVNSKKHKKIKHTVADLLKANQLS